MLIDCYYCNAKVAAEVLAQHEEYGDDPWPYRVSLVVCPACDQSLVAFEESLDYPENKEWGNLLRVWPPRDDLNLAFSIPSLIKLSLMEAHSCLKSQAYIASVAMTGRALEAMCHHFKTKSQYLGHGLKELLQQGIIDNRLFQWSEELRKHRNIAAHASAVKISKDDAKDLFDFALAICDYVFVLNDKFSRFMERKDKRPKPKK